MFEKTLTGLLILIIAVSLHSQDVAFSQKFVSSPYINPALTGIFNGSVRLGVQYRSQWSGPLDLAFTTYGAAGDMNYTVKWLDQASNDQFGVGIQFVNDRVEGIDLNTTLIGLSSSFHKSLNPRIQHYMGIGFQIGMIQKNVNYEQLFFADQYDNIDSYSFPTSEPVPTNNFAVGDFSLGLLYLLSPSDKFAVRAGLAYHHFSTPNLSFFRFDEDYPKNDILPKITLHSTLGFKTGPYTHLLPRFILNIQGPFMDLEIANVFKFTTYSRDYLTFHLGLGTHLVRDLDAVAFSTVVPFVGFQLNNILVGVSYDVGVNTLIRHNRNFSTLEFSVSYLGEYDNQPIFCPKF